MFKRMSILSRRIGDDRDFFARRWRAHGAYIARLPGLRGYIQNHVIGEINPAGLPVDGIVELWFDSPEAMATAFESDVADEMRADEPGFLGRATGYALAGEPPVPDDSVLGSKFWLVEAGTARPCWDDSSLSSATVSRAWTVSDLIAKPGQSAPPVPVARFVEITAGPPAQLRRMLAYAADLGAPPCALFNVFAERLK